MNSKTNQSDTLSPPTPAEEGAGLSATKRALLALKKMQAKLDALDYAKKEPIAVVGMSCRFPGGADTPEHFWELLRSGRDTATEVPKTRWELDAFFDPNTEQPAPGKMYTRHAHFLAQVDQFDAKFFGISPREAVMMDPQQRLMLEVAWEALERANIAPTALRGQQGGVFVGISSHDYARLTNTPLTRGDMYTDTGQMIGVAAGRLAYLLGLHGPTLAVDTACSSSLVALHLAVTSLRLGECNLALAGGVDLMLTPHLLVFVSQMHALAPDGRCKTFDAAADGYGRGEGAAMLVLKRLSDAQANGDQILALIRGSAINHDGATSGLTVPNGAAQEQVIRQALANGGVAPAAVSYIEAHGTGTALGDPIEIEALSAVFPQQPLLIGSVKTNIGHLEAAAGLAGVFKIILALQHQEIPAHLHLHEPNPHIPWAELPITIPTTQVAWSPPAGADVERWTRVAGVSSFGFSGTNAHVILEEAPTIDSGQASVADPDHAMAQDVATTLPAIFTLSAKTEEALLALAARYADHLTAQPELPLADLCFTANTGRAQFNERLALPVRSTDELRQYLTDLPTDRPIAAPGMARGQARKRPQIAFLFTGQGSQYINMGRQLYAHHPVFRHALAACDEILQPLLGQSLLTLLYPETNSAAIHQTVYTQPALFALEYALVQVWRSWGIEPDVVLGHSVGEYVAACVAGLFSLEDGLKLIAERGRLMQALPVAGEMVAVLASAAQVAPFVQPHAHAVAVAAINGPASVVLAGESAALQAICTTLTANGIKSKQLTVSHAFHSPLMEPILADFRRAAEQVTYSRPQMPLISNLTGQLVTDEIATADYWCRHIRQPVNFYASMQTLHQTGCNLFVEIGPNPILLGMGRHCLPEANGLWLPTLREGHDDWEESAKAVAQLYVHGAAIAWENFPTNEHNHTCHKVLLPTYPFQRERYWIAEPETTWAQSANGHGRAATSSPLLQLLQQGDTQQLRNVAQQFGNFSEEQMATVQQVMELLTRRVQQELHIDENGANDWLYAVEWQRKPHRQPHAAHLPPLVAEDGAAQQEGGWLILAEESDDLHPEGGVGQALADRLHAQGEHALLVYASAIADEFWEGTTSDDARVVSRAYFAQLFHTQPPFKGIVHLWSLNTPQTKMLQADQFDAERLEQLQLANCGSLLHLIQALAAHPLPPGAAEPRLHVVTRGAVAVATEHVAVTQAALWGMGRTVALEHPELWGGMVDMAPDHEQATAPAHKTAKDEAEQLLAELVDADSEDQVAWRGGERYVARLVRSSVTATAPAIQADGTYLITGGLGALGLTIAHWLVAQGAKHLLLTGRRGAQGKEDEVRRLTEAGAVVQVVQADVAQADAVAQLLAEAHATMPPLRGIIHAAGVLDDGILLQQSVTRLQQVMQPKVKGAWNLHRLTQGLPLDFFLLFSSDAALLGSSGQGTYAAANAFLDALAHYRHALGLPALSINWGPWGEVGMAARMTAQQQERLAAHGFILIPSAEGLQRLGTLLGMQRQASILNMDWARFLATDHRPLLSALPQAQTDDVKETTTSDPDPFLQQLQAAPPSEHKTLLIGYLQRTVATVLGTREIPSAGEGFFEMGMDSLLTIELRNRLQAALKIAVPTTLAFEYPTIDTLADYLHAALLAAPTAPVAASAPATTTDTTSAAFTKSAPADHVTEIQQLSAAELEALIDGELAAWSNQAT